jgi:hypothetical protein
MKLYVDVSVFNINSDLKWSEMLLAISKILLLNEHKLYIPVLILDSKILITALTRSSINKIDLFALPFETHKYRFFTADRVIEFIINSSLNLSLPPLTVPNLRPIAFFFI